MSDSVGNVLEFRLIVVQAGFLSGSDLNKPVSFVSSSTLWDPLPVNYDAERDELYYDELFEPQVIGFSDTPEDVENDYYEPVLYEGFLEKMGFKSGWVELFLNTFEGPLRLSKTHEVIVEYSFL